MQAASVHPEEDRRLAALHDLEILDSSPEAAWDRLVETASLVCAVPIALISLIDRDRQWFKARIGVQETETSREVSFCAHAIHQDDIFIVQDAAQDERFHDNPLVRGDPSVRFYAGVPVRTPSGHPLGTICVVDKRPRTLDPLQTQVLRLLAQQAQDLLAMREAAQAIQRLISIEGVPTRQRFINGVAHELNTPLTPIVLQLDLLRRRLHDRPDCLRNLDSIERNLARLRKIIDDAIDSLIDPDTENLAALKILQKGTALPARRQAHGPSGERTAATDAMGPA